METMDNAMIGLANFGQAIRDGADARQLGIGEIFDDDQLKSGGVIIYIVLTFYMFMALAIVCDEFFVPSLEVISATLRLPNDVAGATFMAAGGSAPEFFTSLIGNFLGDSSVGISTIVGSAVFNVLLVIGACAFVAPEPLVLTWFPLARDSAFYAVDLIVLSLFFLDEEIQIWESLILFVLYIAYCVFMVYTERLENMAYDKFGRPGGSAPEDSKDPDAMDASLADERANPPPEEYSKPPAPITTEAALEEEAAPAEDTDAADPDSLAITDSQEPEVSSQVEGDLVESNPSAKAKAKAAKGKAKSKGKSKTSGDVKKKKSQTAVPDQEAGATPSGTLQADTNHGAVWLDESNLDVAVWGSDDESIEVEMRQFQVEALHRTADQGSAKTSVSSRNDLKRVSKMIDKEHIPKPPENVEVAEKVAEEEGSDEEESEPLELSFPFDGSTFDKVWFVVAFPLLVAMAFTIPDVRREGREKFFVFSFFMSIAWIGAFTYVMVESITVVSDVLQIPVTIFALTVVAGGTSVPDLLTSVIVAKKGRGDMAVSSSIGSNIFDVTVGMPVPWLIYMIAKGITSISVGAKGLLFSVSLLLGMLVMTILAIMLCKWVMDRKLGFAMVILYIVFLVVCLIQMW